VPREGISDTQLPSGSTASDAPPAVAVRGLEKRFGAIVAVAGLDLEIGRGELFGLVGPDGAGKTTLLRVLATAMLPTAGSGRVTGCDLVSEPETIKRRIGYVPQRFSLYGSLTVRENLEFFADIFRVFGPERETRFREVLGFSRLGPFQDRLARDLSGGMRQKLALAAALLHTPELLLLDEPTTGVDPISRRELWKLLLDLWRGGVTVLVTTPYMDEAERCERIGFMRAGRLLDVASPATFKARYPYRVVEVGCGDRRGARAALLGQPGVAGVELFGDKIHVRTEGTADRTAELSRRLETGGFTVDSMRTVPPSVEDIFLELAGRGGDADAG
jgi:ABC-2 type transport system ATP-binding protein